MTMTSPKVSVLLLIVAIASLFSKIYRKCEQAQTTISTRWARQLSTLHGLYLHRINFPRKYRSRKPHASHYEDTGHYGRQSMERAPSDRFYRALTPTGAGVYFVLYCCHFRFVRHRLRHCQTINTVYGML